MITSSLIVSLIAILAICAILWYVVNALGLPPPIRVAAIAVMGIVAILFLLQFVGGGVRLP